jgi:hypothetical protein
MCERLARIHRVDRPIVAERHVAVYLFCTSRGRFAVRSVIGRGSSNEMVL